MMAGSESDNLGQKLIAITNCQKELKAKLQRDEHSSARCFALENQLSEFGSAIATLQRSLSDTQARLNYERTIAKQLQIENQYLKYKLKEQERSIQALSRLLGTDHVTIKNLLQNPEVQKIGAGIAGLGIEGVHSTTASSGSTTDSDAEQATSASEYVLGRDLEKMRDVAKEMGAVFLRDREILQDERETERNMLEEKLRKLNEELFNTQEELRKISSRYTDLRVTDATSVKHWESEKLACLSRMKSLSSVSTNEEALTIVQSLMEVLDPSKKSGIVAKLRREVKELRAIVDEATQIAEQYRVKSTSLQKQMDEVKEECEEVTSKCKGEMDSARTHVAKTIERYNKLEEKTKMEFSGYRNEIALLKEELRRAEKKLYFLTLKQSF